MAIIEISPTARADVADLQKVADAAGLFPGDMLPDMIAGFWEDTSHIQWLTCRSDEFPVGFVYAEAEQLADRVWNMYALCVLPDHQRAGLGQRLVSTLEHILKEMGQRLLIVDTSSGPAFAGARQFYETNHYHKEAVIRDYWEDGDDKVTFRKML